MSEDHDTCDGERNERPSRTLEWGSVVRARLAPSASTNPTATNDATDFASSSPATPATTSRIRNGALLVTAPKAAITSSSPDTRPSAFGPSAPPARSPSNPSALTAAKTTAPTPATAIAPSTIRTSRLVSITLAARKAIESVAASRSQETIESESPSGFEPAT